MIIVGEGSMISEKGEKALNYRLNSDPKNSNKLFDVYLLEHNLITLFNILTLKR